jgi:hypothetical protein
MGMMIHRMTWRTRRERGKGSAMWEQAHGLARHGRAGSLRMRWQLTDDGLRCWWEVARANCSCGWSGMPGAWQPTDLRDGIDSLACPRCGGLRGQEPPAALAA